MASVYAAIVTACTDRLLAAGFAVRNRKRAEVLDADVADLPLVLLVTGSGEQTDTYDSEDFVVVRYPVLAVWVDAGNQLYEAAFATVLQAREDVRRQLHRTEFPGATSVYDCEPDFAPAFDSAALDAGFDYTAIQFWYLSHEPRFTP